MPCTVPGSFGLFWGHARPQGVRCPDPFTGFDESDNIYMGSLAKQSPENAQGNALSNGQVAEVEKQTSKTAEKTFSYR